METSMQRGLQSSHPIEISDSEDSDGLTADAARAAASAALASSWGVRSGVKGTPGVKRQTPPAATATPTKSNTDHAASTIVPHRGSISPPPRKAVANDQTLPATRIVHGDAGTQAETSAVNANATAGTSLVPPSTSSPAPSRTRIPSSQAQPRTSQLAWPPPSSIGNVSTQGAPAPSQTATSPFLQHRVHLSRTAPSNASVSQQRPAVPKQTPPRHSSPRPPPNVHPPALFGKLVPDRWKSVSDWTPTPTKSPPALTQAPAASKPPQPASQTPSQTPSQTARPSSAVPPPCIEEAARQIVGEHWAYHTMQTAYKQDAQLRSSGAGSFQVFRQALELHPHARDSPAALYKVAADLCSTTGEHKGSEPAGSSSSASAVPIAIQPAYHEVPRTQSVVAPLAAADTAGNAPRLQANTVSQSREPSRTSLEAGTSRLPTDVLDFLRACQLSRTSSGRLNKAQVVESLKDSPAAAFFDGSGDLKTTSPIWNYTLEQLGMHPDVWAHLNRAGNKDLLPGPGMQRKKGRPPTANETKSTNEPTDYARIDTAGRLAGRSASDSNAEKLNELLKAVDAARARHSITLGGVWQPEEDELLIYLKEQLALPWHEIGSYFKYRAKTWHTCQGRYSKKLSNASRPLAPASQPAFTYIAPRPTTERLPIGTPSTSDTELDGDEINSAAPHAREARPRRKQTTNVIYNAREYFKSIRLGDSQNTQAREDADADPDVDMTDDEGPGSKVARRTVGGEVDGPRASSLQTERKHPSTTIPAVQRAPLPWHRVRADIDRDKAALGGGLLKLRRKPMLAKAPQDLPRSRPTRLAKRASIDVPRPYLNLEARKFLESSFNDGLWSGDVLRDWEGAILHVDLSQDELARLQQALLDELDDNAGDLWTDVSIDGPSTQSQLGRALVAGAASAPDTALVRRRIARIIYRAQLSGLTLNRTVSALDDHLCDSILLASAEDEPARAMYLHRIAPTPRDFSIHKTLRSREIGAGARNLGPIQSAVADTLRPWKSWTGASHDINAVAWAPDGAMFAIGAAALTDPHSMQYNRNNNLLIGDAERNFLRELPHHVTKRGLTASGANSTQVMHETQGPLLFQSVTAVGFSATSMFTTGYDNFTRMWDIRPGAEGTHLRWSFHHPDKVTLLAVNNDRGILATGSIASKSNVNIFKDDLDTDDGKRLKLGSRHSPRAMAQPEKFIKPSCLKWGSTLWEQSKYLLCGFASMDLDGEFKSGEVCLWNVEAEHSETVTRGVREVFDVAWSPSIFGRFAMATSAGGNVNRGTKSVVQIYDGRALAGGSMQTNPVHAYELECPALDVNDLIFNPKDESLISVGCTDGSVYLWDLRKPDIPLHQFKHGLPLLERDHSRELEEYDTGVHFLHWDVTRRHLLSGSSDGVLAQWNPYRATEDAFCKSITTLKSGIMCGAFNSDHSRLLLGEVDGSINILAVGRDEADEEDDTSPFLFQRATEAELNGIREILAVPITREISGAEAARELVGTGQIEIKPWASCPRGQAVQGPQYSGPYQGGLDAPVLRQQAAAFQHRFTAEPGMEPCRVCADNVPLFSEEDVVDNGAWRARIPAASRLVRSAGPRQTTCPRCGKLTDTLPDDVVHCHGCRRAWRRDLLGHTPLDVARHRSVEFETLIDAKDGMDIDGPLTTDDAPAGWLRQAMRDLGVEERRRTDLADLQNVEDYHHALWR